MNKSLLDILIESLLDDEAEAPDEKSPEAGQKDAAPEDDTPTPKITGNVAAKVADKPVDTNAENVMDRFKILRLTLWDLLVPDGTPAQKNDDLDDLVGDISIVSYKPTCFDIKFKNGNHMVLKYEPTPQQVNPNTKNKFKPKDYFICQIAGKKYSLMNHSEYLQCQDYISQALKTKSSTTTNNTTANGEGGAPHKPEQLGKDQPGQSPTNEPEQK